MLRKQHTRRNFLQRAVAAGSVLSARRTHQAMAANDQVNVGIIGLGMMGGGHARFFPNLNGVRVSAISDADSQRMGKAANHLPSSTLLHQDFRRILDDKSIDAVVIATPNHWHALMTIMACQAGKHVYVQKPVSHNIWEGRKMVEAARRYNRIVQAGTQHRSCPAVQKARTDILAGKYGRPKWVHCSVLHTRKSIGHVSDPLSVPDHIDYDLWTGPAPKVPVMRKSFHYDWHWQWNWGDGETGNWGPHYADDLRNLLGWDDVPDNVVAAGNRFVWKDNGETPNVHLALFDHRNVKVVIDIRNLPDPSGPGGATGAIYRDTRGGNYIHCEDAVIRLARGGGTATSHDGELIQQYSGNGGEGHEQNFIHAIRAGDRNELNCEITQGHLSTVMCHQANIAFRVGHSAPPEQIRENLKSHPDAVETFNDMARQLGGNSVDLAEQPFLLGPQLHFDREVEQFRGEGAAVANELVAGTYRAPFAVPTQV